MHTDIHYSLIFNKTSNTGKEKYSVWNSYLPFMCSVLLSFFYFQEPWMATLYSPDISHASFKRNCFTLKEMHHRNCITVGEKKTDLWLISFLEDRPHLSFPLMHRALFRFLVQSILLWNFSPISFSAEINPSYILHSLFLPPLTSYAILPKLFGDNEHNESITGRISYLYQTVY